MVGVSTGEYRYKCNIYKGNHPIRVRVCGPKNLYAKIRVNGQILAIP